MNYTVLILAVATVFGLSDFFTSRSPLLQKSIYKIAFATIFFLCAIKYYYGGDVVTYYEHFCSLTSLSDVWHHPKDFNFEYGYSLLCVLLKDIGLSFYQMTVVFTIIYFTAIYLLFRDISSHKSFALMVLMVVSCDLILIQFRQCLSVAFFVFSILSLNRRQPLLYVLFTILTVSVHAAGIFCVMLYWGYALCCRSGLSSNSILLLMLLLIVFIIFPPGTMFQYVANYLPSADKIIFHISFGRRFQSVLLFYMVVMFVLYYFQNYNTPATPRFARYATITAIGVTLITFLYYSYPLLLRLRNFYAPFLIVYIFHLVHEGRLKTIPYYGLVCQSVTFVIFIYSVHFMASTYAAGQQLRYNTTRCSTVFDLLKHSALYVRNRQLTIAKKSQYDFQKWIDENNLKDKKGK